MFDGKYVTSDVDEVYLKRLDNIRNDAAKKSKKNRLAKEKNPLADLHNDA